MTDSLFISTLKKNHLDNLDISRIKERLENEDFSIFDLDISKKINLCDTYDVIYASNISNYIKLPSKDYDRFRNNLYNLLNDDGILYATDFGDPDFPEELSGELFSCEEVSLRSVYSFEESRGFIYRKR